MSRQFTEADIRRLLDKAGAKELKRPELYEFIAKWVTDALTPTAMDSGLSEIHKAAKRVRELARRYVPKHSQDFPLVEKLLALEELLEGLFPHRHPPPPDIDTDYIRPAQRLLIVYRTIVGSGTRNRNSPAMRFVVLTLMEAGFITALDNPDDKKEMERKIETVSKRMERWDNPPRKSAERHWGMLAELATLRRFEETGSDREAEMMRAVLTSPFRGIEA